MQVTVDGHEVYVHTGGRPFDPAAKVVVLVHGSGFDHTAWRYQSRWLAHRGVSVAAVDLPGHGRSGGPLLGTVEELAAWCGRLLESLGADEGVIVGHSLGALVALQAVADDARWDAGVLVSGAQEMRVHPEMLASAAEGAPRVLELMRAWMHASHGGGHLDPGHWLMGESWSVQEAEGYDVLHADLLACHRYEGGAAAAAAADRPILVISGTADRMVPLRASSALVDALPNGVLAEVEGAGHLPFVVRPRAVNRRLADFLGIA
ncbi:MAG: alpha/beta hydrolase [Acidimicrobiia bacterium]|nr:alpha/beta hydrolase [Acidimicrobiia bacterium]